MIFQEWVKNGDPEALDLSFGTDLFARVTLVTDPQRRHWNMTRGRSCSLIYNQEDWVFLGPADRAVLQREFDEAFSGFSHLAPDDVMVWGNADAPCYTQFMVTLMLPIPPNYNMNPKWKTYKLTGLNISTCACGNNTK